MNLAQASACLGMNFLVTLQYVQRQHNRNMLEGEITVRQESRVIVGPDFCFWNILKSRALTRVPQRGTVIHAEGST